MTAAIVVVTDNLADPVPPTVEAPGDVMTRTPMHRAAATENARERTAIATVTLVETGAEIENGTATVVLPGATPDGTTTTTDTLGGTTATSLTTAGAEEETGTTMATDGATDSGARLHLPRNASQRPISPMLSRFSTGSAA